MIPPRSILAATDFSEPSRVAATFAACLAKQCHATFHLLHAEDPLLSAAARQEGIDLNHDTREALQAFVAAEKPLADYAPLHHVVTGPATDVIIDVARRENVDLIVIGSHGMSGTARLIFGSTAEGVLRRTGTSVLVVPPGWRPVRAETPDLSGIGPVVVGIDLSQASIDIASAACALAATLGTSVEAVHVVAALSVPERWRAHADRAVRQRLDSARAELEDSFLEMKAPVRVHMRIESGRVAERLAEIASSSPDRHPMLMLGRRPGRLGAPPGAIAYRALTLAAVPVLMYVPEERPGDAKNP